jgi:hypothetical protein
MFHLLLGYFQLHEGFAASSEDLLGAGQLALSKKERKARNGRNACKERNGRISHAWQRQG